MSRSGLRAPALAMRKRRRMQIESVRTTFIDPLLSHHGIKGGSAIGLRWRIFPASCMFGVIRDRGIKILHPANWIRGPLRAGYFRTSVARTLARASAPAEPTIGSIRDIRSATCPQSNDAEVPVLTLQREPCDICRHVS